MTYQEAVHYIEQTETPRIRYGLDKLKQALALMGNPQDKVKFIHIAGTNGKGSCAAMLSSVLSESGYKTGLYISPHLVRYNERLQINGQNISDEDFISLVEEVKSVCETLGGTPIVFEVLTLMAFWYFAKQNCDIVVLEVGIGGRIDSTNVIPTPEVAVIAQLGIDHTETLGSTLTQIASEKGGIAKPNGRVVMAKQEAESISTVENICRSVGASFTIADPERLCVISESADGQRLIDKEYGELFLPLAGKHQIHNAANVLESIGILKSLGYRITDENIKNGIARTSWPARFQKLLSKPDFILDGGHNPQCVQSAVDALKLFYPGKEIIFLAGMMADKDTHSMLKMMAEIAKCFVCVTLDSPRAMTAEALRDTIQNEYHKPARTASDLKSAVDTVLSFAGEEDVICALGSLYLAGEVGEIVKALQK